MNFLQNKPIKSLYKKALIVQKTFKTSKDYTDKDCDALAEAIKIIKSIIDGDDIDPIVNNDSIDADGDDTDSIGDDILELVEDLTTEDCKDKLSTDSEFRFDSGNSYDNVDSSSSDSGGSDCSDSGGSDY